MSGAEESIRYGLWKPGKTQERSEVDLLRQPTIAQSRFRWAPRQHAAATPNLMNSYDCSEG
jgi:hypothetical protein